MLCFPIGAAAQPEGLDFPDAATLYDPACPYELQQEAWTAAVGELLASHHEDCIEALSNEGAPLCAITRKDIVSQSGSTGPWCLPDLDALEASLSYMVGRRLLDSDNTMMAERFLDEARSLAPDNLTYQLAWTDVFGQQLRQLAMSKSSVARNARDVQTLALAALRFYPDDAELRRQMRQLEVSTSDQNYGVQRLLLQCTKYVIEGDPKDKPGAAEAACRSARDASAAGEPDHRQAVQLLELIALKTKYSWATAELARFNGELERCGQAYNARDWKGAAAPCKNAFDLNPQHEDAAWYHGEVLAAQQRRQNFKLWWFFLLGLAIAGAISLLALYFQGDLFRSLGKPHLAVAAYAYLSTVRPAWRKPLLRMAHIHKQAGDTDAERAILQQAEATWPSNLAIMRKLLDFYTRVGDLKGIRDSILHMAQSTDLRAEQVVSLLEAQRSLGLMEDQVLEELEERIGERAESPLLPLLALAYSQRGRIDERAERIYRLTLALPDTRLHFLVPLAQLELQAGRGANAIELAEQAVEQNATAEAVDCLTDCLIKEEMEEHLLWAEPPAGNILLLFPALLRVAGMHPEHSPMIAERIRAFLEQSDDPSVIFLSAGVAEMLEEHECHDQLLSAADSIDGTVPYLKAVEAAFAEYARRNPEDGMLWLQLSEIHRKLQRRPLAIQTLKKAFEIESSRNFAMRQAKAMLTDLETHQVIELLATQLGLRCRPVRRSAEGYLELIWHNPEKPLEGWWSSLKNARVRVYTKRAPVPDDVLAFKRSAAKSVPHCDLAIMVSVGRPGAATIEYIITSMIDGAAEDRPLRMLPMEDATLREAVAEFRPEEMLTQLRSQWLLGEDVFDKKDPVFAPGEFFGRGQVLRTLVNKAHRGEAFGLFGLRKMGKTSLAYRLRDYLSDAVVGMVDLEEISTSSCSSLAHRLCQRTLEDWQEKFPHIPLPELEDIQEDDRSMIAFEANLRDLRKAILASEEISTLFFIIDEIELVIPHDLDKGQSHPGFTGFDRFFRLMRGLHQADFKDVFAFSVFGANASLCLQGKWGGFDNPIFQYLSEIFIGPLSPGESSEMVLSLGSGMALSYSDSALALLHDYSGGHPMVCRQLCSEARKVAGDAPARITAQVVREAKDGYLASKPDYFIQVLSSYLRTGQKQILYAVAAEDDGTITRSELYNQLRRRFPDRDAFDRDLQVLEQFFLLNRRGDLYRFSMRILRTYIRVFKLGLTE